MRSSIHAILGLFLTLNPLSAAETEIFARENLVAWCIVPFDAAKRGPAARAEMLSDLRLGKCAYDWRAEHVPTFEEEIQEYAKRGIEFFAFWGAHEDAFSLFQTYELTPQIWQTAPSPKGADQTELIKAAAEQLTPLVERTRELGCALGLYNHGGWGGQPENLVAVCQHLRQTQNAQHVGIVYNLHHGHDHLATFEESLTLMQPFLHCLNLNGMNSKPEPKILPIGRGEHDERLLTIIAKSGYEGPIGILDHRNETDAKESLQQNLDGLGAWVKRNP